MEDWLVVVVCVVVALPCVVALALLPEPISASDIVVRGTVRQVFAPGGITIAYVDLEGGLPVVFLDGRELRVGQVVDANATIGRYQESVELIVG